jgi:DNA ligase-1
MKGNALEDEDFDKLIFPLYASPKIDGFRCVLTNEAPLSSRLSRFPNDFLNKNLANVAPVDTILDGELVVGKRRGEGVLGRTSSGITSRSGEPDFTLWVFDTFQRGYGFGQRHQLARQIVEDLDHPRIKILKHTLLMDLDELHAYIEARIARGYEGVMIRSVDGPYKEGKSTIREGYLLKIKPFDTCEGRIKGWFEEEKNNNEAKREATGKLKRSSSKKNKVPKGRLGGFILDDIKNGVEVRVGGGFTAAQRQWAWRLIQKDPKFFLGKLVRYKKQTVGEKDKPRHPNFLEFVDFRPEWDMTDY